MAKPKSKQSVLATDFAQRIRDGTVEFKRNSNRTIGLCFFCDQQKSLTKFQWQFHLLTHTMEHFYFCHQCVV